MPRAERYVQMLAFALLVPAVIAVIALPTPASDTREAFTWGHFFSLETPKHPPMMQWIAGLTARLLGPSAVAAILVTQALNAAAIYYLYKIFLEMLDRPHALMFALLAGTNFYVTASALPNALNADMLQILPWSGIVCHAVRAARGDRWLDWLALGLWAAAAIYTKYTVAVLFLGLGVAAAMVPSYRHIWTRPGLYAAAALAGLLVVPHAWASLTQQGSLGHAEGLLNVRNSLGARLTNFSRIGTGLFIYTAPAWIIMVGGFLRRDCRWSRPDGEWAAATLRFLQIVCIVCFAVLAVLVLGGGLRFVARYVAPFLFLVALAALPMIAFDRTRWAGIERRVLTTLGVVSTLTLVGPSLVWTLFSHHDVMQEPSANAAALLRAEWSKSFTCGPAYMLGDIGSGNGMAVTGDRPLPVGIPLDMVKSVAWFDRAELDKRGAIVVYRDAINWTQVDDALPGAGRPATRQVIVPMLRTLTGAAYTYVYFFIPAAQCR